MTTASTPLEPGQTLGDYRIERALQQGGMGAVFEATHRILGVRHALKVILPVVQADEDMRRRFVREACLAMEVQHPNVVRSYPPFQHGELVVLPMELLRGEGLHAWLKRMHRADVAQLRALMLPICEGVQAIHDRGILHRDLKPTNIFLRAVGDAVVPTVIDLGVARQVGGEELTVGNMVLGTPAYMPPEQIKKAPALDHRADQFALGVMAYQLVTGRKLYPDTDPMVVGARILSHAPFPTPRELVPSVPPALDAVILRALAWDADARFESVRAFAQALDAACPPEGDEVDTLTSGIILVETEIPPKVPPNDPTSGARKTPPGVVNEAVTGPPAAPWRTAIAIVAFGVAAFAAILLRAPPHSSIANPPRLAPAPQPAAVAPPPVAPPPTVQVLVPLRVAPSVAPDAGSPTPSPARPSPTAARHPRRRPQRPPQRRDGLPPM